MSTQENKQVALRFVELLDKKVLEEAFALVADDAIIHLGGGWEVSDEAKQLVRAASDDWGRAAIDAGEDRSHAHRAAEATRRFYSGEPPLES